MNDIFQMSTRYPGRFHP